MIPLVDLSAQHREVAAEVAAGFAAVIERTAFVGGEEVAAFERELAAFVGVADCVAVANGTDALELALRASGIGPGDEVIVPVNTFAATAFAVVRAGAVPVFADCDPEHHLLDPARLPLRATSRALFAVHLFGQMAPMAALAAAAPGVILLEDAAQAHGASQDGRAAGAVGTAAGTSFYPGKNLGAYGDGGAVLTGDRTIGERVRALRNYGSPVKYEHPVVGVNSRLDTLQAVVLRAKLVRLAGWNDARRRAAERYHQLLADVTDVVRPTIAAGNVHVWHIYAVRVPRRDAVLRRLVAAGIGAGVHYPIPLHLQGAFTALGHRRGDFPVAERAADELLSLPLFPHITGEQQERVVAALRGALEAS